MSAVIQIKTSVPSRRFTDLSMVHKFMLADVMLENRELRSNINKENGVPACPFCLRHVLHEVEAITEEMVLKELGL